MCMRSKYGPGGEFDPEWYEQSCRLFLVLTVVVLGNLTSHPTLGEMAGPHRLVADLPLLEDHFHRSSQSLLPKLRGAKSIRLRLRNFQRGRSDSKGKPKQPPQAPLDLLPMLERLPPGPLGSVSRG